VLAGKDEKLFNDQFRQIGRFFQPWHFGTDNQAYTTKTYLLRQINGAQK
jgi:hypothetical protein